MIKKHIQKTIVFCSLIGLLALVISCEKDFTDIGSSIISNTQFNTKDTILEVVVTEKPITSVRADGIQLGGNLGQYLLGVYNNVNYEKIEASIVSQLGIQNDLALVNQTYGADTTVVTTIDTVYIKLPYQASLKTDGSDQYVLDSVIGNTSVPFSVNVYQLQTFLNRLNPNDPSKTNSFSSDEVYQWIPGTLTSQLDYPFVPSSNDTAIFVKRRTHLGEVYDTDTISLTNNIPFARIPLDKNKIKSLFLDQYGTANFASQDAFNNYFRGIMIEAKGDDGSMVSLSLTSPTIGLNASIEVLYTNTVLDGAGAPVDTIKVANTYSLSGISTSLYKMTQNNPSSSHNVIVQGTAGTMANVALFGEDLNNNNIPDQIDDLRQKNWLINDASLTLYVDQDIVDFDTIATPYRLLIYKDGLNGSGNPNPSQIKDILTEGSAVLGGALELSEDGRPDKYNFRITDYVSDLLNGKSTYSPILGVKLFSPTDVPTSVSDTIIESYSWNPKAVMLLNHLPSNGARRAQLKISYSVKAEN